MGNRENPAPVQNNAEYRMDMVIGNLLRYGVVTAGIVVLLGGIYYLFRHGGEYPEYRMFHSEPAQLRTFGGILGLLLSLKARAVIQFGLLLLIATPVARVAFSVFAFARQRDFTYIFVTLFVLAALIFSLIGGHL
jgi:uncharacterized membrane protein